MCKPLSYSAYLSTFPLRQTVLEGAPGSGATVFLSLHISEEFGEGALSSPVPERT